MSELAREFAKVLKEFRAGGYKFPNGKELRKGTQEEAIEGYIKGLLEKIIHGHYEIPTGVGKTAIFIALVHNFLLAAANCKSDKRVLIVVPSTDLVIQTAKAFAKFMPDVAKLIEADDDDGKQIDWENSEVGAQYGKLKHAHRKPKVLITTYQSLAQDSNNTIYPPEEYGFVIYDEGHFITGEKFSKSVRKFAELLQLAVTATTEYSEDKNVQMHLKHEYYRLPIKTAIKRGDLCNVQPVLVQTDFMVDQDKFDEFMLKNNGRPLTKKQKDALFNQVVRNEAIIESYLIGKDEETGETYFGQSGLVFAAGVKHCTDLKNQFNEKLNTEQFRPLKEWMKKEGIALMAEIHGKTKGEILTIDGIPQFYNKDQIKELHRRGKILLLISDQELKQGTDFPADAIIMDAVDRYSWVDTKQRYGRGYRLDPEDKAKTCKVINYIDKNTIQLYGDTPENLPIYCAETLEGVQFKKTPGRGAFKRFKSKPPMLEEALLSSGFELITDIDRVIKISAGFKKKREDAIFPPKTDEWLSKTDYAGFLGTASINEKFTAFWSAAEENEIEWVPSLQCGTFQSATRSSFCINISEASRIRQHLGLKEIVSLGKKEEGWLSLHQGLQILGNTSKNKVKVEQFWEDAAADKIKFKPPLKAGNYTSRNFITHYCIHESEIERVRNYLSIKEMPIVGELTDEWLMRADVAQKLEVNVQNEKLRNFFEMAENGEVDLDPPLKSGYFKSGTRKPFCVHKSEVERVRNFVGLEVIEVKGIKTEEWLHSREFAELVKVAEKGKAFQSFWEGIENGALKFRPALKCGYFKSAGQKPFCVHRDEVERVRKHLGVKDVSVAGAKTENVLTRREFALRLNTAPQKGKFSDFWVKAEAGKIKMTPPLRCGVFQLTTLRAFCLHEDEIPRVREYLGMKEVEVQGEKTPEWLSKIEFASAMNMTIKRHDFKVFWAAAEEGSLDFKPKLKCGVFKSGGHRSFHIHESEAERVKEYINSQKAEPSSIVKAAATKIEESMGRGRKTSRG